MSFDRTDGLTKMLIDPESDRVLGVDIVSANAGELTERERLSQSGRMAKMASGNGTGITSSWGKEQSIIGPVLIVPYRYSIKSWKEQPVAGGKSEKVEVVETAVANAYFLPSTLAIEGGIQPTRLRRGIYQAVVYTGKFEFSGNLPGLFRQLENRGAERLVGRCARLLRHPGLARGKGNPEPEAVSIQ